VAMLFFSRLGMAQSLPPGALDQLDRAIGQRVEATAVVGTQSIATRSGLGWKLNDAEGEILKQPWKFELFDPMPMGDDWLQWTPVLEGGVGYGGFENHFNNSTLAGNQSDFDTIALSIGSGPRLYFGDTGFSVLPAFDFLFAYTENHFTAGTPAGEALVTDGRYVNWETWTISFVPSFEGRYKKTFGRWTPEFTSTVAYFHTIPLSRSTDALSFRSDSGVWANRADLDYLTPWSVWHFPMHLGGSFTRTDLYGGLRDSMGTDHYYDGNARITFDLNGQLWKLTEIGIVGGYFWSDAFDGFSFGITGDVKF